MSDLSLRAGRLGMGAGTMADGTLIDNEDVRSTRMRAREVRGEVLAGPERRRRWSVEEKLRMAQSVAAGSSVKLVCRMHGISSGQLYTWRRQFRTGDMTGFAPVIVSSPLGQPASVSSEIDRASADPGVDRPASGAIEVELRPGVKLRITGAVDEVALRQVLSALS